MSASIRIKIIGGTDIDGAYADCARASCHLGGISVETDFNGVEMLFHGQSLRDWLDYYNKHNRRIMGCESTNKQCWECANCKEPTAGWDRSKFSCAHLGKDFDTWHYDVPNECPCKGNGWMPNKKKRGAKCR